MNYMIFEHFYNKNEIKVYCMETFSLIYEIKSGLSLELRLTV